MRSVWMRPGCTVFTRMPSRPRSVASVFAIPVTPVRTALERMRFRYWEGWRTVVLVMNTMLPFDRRRCGSASRVSRTAEKSVSSTARSHAVSSTSSKRPGGGPPAFETSASSPP